MFPCEADPLVSRALIAARGWLSLLDHLLLLHNKMRQAWRIVLEHVAPEGKVLWNRVTGPIGSVIGSLVEAGWTPSLLSFGLHPMEISTALHLFFQCLAS